MSKIEAIDKFWSWSEWARRLGKVPPTLPLVQGSIEANEVEAVSPVPLLDELVRDAARQMLAVALAAEVSAYIEAHVEEVDEAGDRLVVGNGHRVERDVNGGGPGDGQGAAGQRQAHRRGHR